LKPKLSIVISNRNDIVMLNVTLNDAIEAMKGLDCESEIILVDNSDKKFYELMPIAYPVGFIKKHHLKVFRLERPSFTAARMMAAEKASGEYIFCVDSHVLFGHNTLRDSIAFMDSMKHNPQMGFGHPPVRWAHQGDAAVKHTLQYSDLGTPWGQWGPSITRNQKIFWKFMPWIANREWYLNVLKGYGSHAKHFISWGGAEMLQQIKSWMLGYEQWGIMTDPIIHIGPYTPEVVKTGQYKYRTYSDSGTGPHGLGVLIAFYVLGGPVDGLKHAKLSEQRILNRHHIAVNDYWPTAMKYGKEEHEWLMANKKYGYLELLEKKPWNDDSVQNLNVAANG